MSSTLSIDSAPTGITAWTQAGARLVARAIAELSHEQLVSPEATGGRYQLVLGPVTYSFDATRDRLSAWHVDHAGLLRDGSPADDLARFFLDARVVTCLDAVTLAEVLREATATQSAEARVLAGSRPVRELLDLEYAELEQHLPGHPVLVLNKGRLGLDAADLERYAPEARGTLALCWYAAHPDLATYSAVPDLDARDLRKQELTLEERSRFSEKLSEAGAAGDNYVWFPVHPYQEDMVVRTLFAGELATGRLIRLGAGDQQYRPVQSVRSLVGARRRDVKTSLLMRNTLVWRGLGASATEAAPEISRWLGALHAADRELQGTGIGFLREQASVVVRHPHYADVPDAPYRYAELLGAIWREPVAGQLTDRERARSLATLLHVDHHGTALVGELIERSSMSAKDWLRTLCRALFPGLLLCLTRHGIAFCPHGENTILIFEDNVPTRILVKDFAEDITLLPDRGYPGLPPDAARVLVRWPLTEMAHSITSAILTGHFRYLAPLLREHCGLGEDTFWRVVREELLDWRDQHPDLAASFDELGLLAPTFERIALNREQLTGGGFHDRAERDAEPDLMHGRIPNPMYDPQETP